MTSPSVVSTAADEPRRPKLVVTLLGDSAEWKAGPNRVVLEFHSAPRKRLAIFDALVGPPPHGQ